jgi:tape measure domain-containing protein
MAGEVKRSISVYLNLDEANKSYDHLKKQVDSLKTSMQSLTKGSKEYAASEKELKKLEAALREQQRIINDTPGSILNVRKAYRQASAELNRMVVGSAEYNDKIRELRVLQATLDQHRQSLRGAANESTGLFGALQKIGGLGTIFGALGVGALASQVGGLVGEMTTLSLESEKIGKAFEVFLGSWQAASKMMEDLQQFGFGVGVALPTDEINNSAKSLLAFGIESEKIIPTLENIADVSAGTGKNFQELAIIYGKAKTAGVLYAEDINQLTEAGIPIIAELARQMGVNENQVKKLGSEGKITFDLLEKSFQSMTNEGGIFFNLTTTQAETAAGKMAILKKEILNSGKSIVDALIPAITSVVAGLITLVRGFAAIPEFVRENKEELIALGVALVGFNTQAIIATANSLRLAAVEKARAIATGAVTLAQNLLNGAMRANPIGLVITAVGLLSAAFIALYKRSQNVRASIAGLGAMAKEVFTIVKESISGFVEGFQNLKEGNFTAAFKNFGSALVKSNPIGMAFTQGKRLGKAFNKGFDDLIFNETAADIAKKAKEMADLAESQIGGKTSSGGKKTGPAGETEEQKKARLAAQKQAEKDLKDHVNRVNKILDDAREKEAKDDQSELARKEIDIRAKYESEIALARQYAKSKNDKIAKEGRERELALEQALQEELLILRSEYLEKNQKKISDLSEIAHRNTLTENEREIQAIKDKYAEIIANSQQLEKDLANATIAEKIKAAAQTQELQDLMNKEIETKTAEHNAKLVKIEEEKKKKEREDKEKLRKDYEDELKDLNNLELKVGDDLYTALDAHYEKLIQQADQLGLSRYEITEKWEKKKAELENASRLAQLSAYGDAFGKLGDVISKFTDDQAKQSRDWVILQRGLSLAQIAIDTARAISSLVAASSANPTNAVTFGAAGAAQFIAGIAQILGNIASAKKLLSTPIPQAVDGGWKNVTGDQDGKRYNAKYLGHTKTGMLPAHPSLVLASEEGPEYYVSNQSLKNPKIARMVRMIDNVERGRRMTQRVDGGVYPDKAVLPASDGGESGMMLSVMTSLLRVLSHPIYAILPDQTIIGANERLQSMNASSGGRLLSSKN